MSDRSERDQLPQRHSTRLARHNYRWTASYFVTIRRAHHQPVFDIPELHAIVENTWNTLPTRFACVSLDDYVVMPDHFHAILHFLVTDTPAPSLGQVIGAYKSITTVKWFDYIKTHNVYWSGLLWQRNYHDHVIRDAHDLEQKRLYIRNNPLRWETETNPYC
jgi:putative transposase